MEQMDNLEVLDMDHDEDEDGNENNGDGGDVSDSDDENPNKKQKLEVQDQNQEEEDQLECEADAEINPFLVDKIIDCMVGQMGIEEILNVRSVCSVWDQRAIERLNSISDILMPIDLDTEQHTTSFKGMMYFSEIQKLFRKFVIHWNIFKTINIKFFSEFRPTTLRILLNSNKADLDYHSLMRKLQQCSTHLKLLSLYRTTSKTMLLKETLNLDQDQDQNGVDLEFPRLESLQIGHMKREVDNFDIDQDEDDNEENPPPPQILEDIELNKMNFLVQIFKSIVSNSLNLSQIKLIGLPCRYMILTNDLFVNEDGGIAENIISKIKHFTCLFTGFRNGIANPLVMSQFNSLNSNGKLNLLSFEVKFSADYKSDMEAASVKNELLELKKFLDSQKHTLENLFVSIGVGYDNFHYKKEVVLTLPTMQNLKKLTLKNTTAIVDLDETIDPEELNPYPFAALNLSTQFPRLCEITIISSIIFQGLQNILNGVSTTVKKVTLQTNSYGPELFDLSAYFPAVTTFKLHFSAYYNPDEDPIQFPWEATLTTLILDITPDSLRNFNFANLFHLSKLKYLEINNVKRINTGMNDIKHVSLKKLKLRHLRIKDFRLDNSVVSELGEAFSFEYLCLPIAPIISNSEHNYSYRLHEDDDSQSSFQDSLP